MTTNVRQFVLEVNSFGQTVTPQTFIVFYKKVTLDFVRSVVEKNPVLTGHSRLNWQVGISATNEEELERFGLDTAIVFDDARAALDGITETNPYLTIFVFNNTPYILRLEDGWSSQAPDGFVEMTVDEFRTALS